MSKENKLSWYLSPAFWFLISAIAIAIITVTGPEEKTLGANARIVYLHGAWVWTALAGFVCAAISGAAGLITGRELFHNWSTALGRTGLIFWITYLPVSLWAMQTNWNGLFLAEPRWRFAFVFAIFGLLFQLGLALINRPLWTSAGNILFAILLFIGLLSTEDVMHPPSPIPLTDAPSIQVVFTVMRGFMLLAAWQVARWLYQAQVERKNPGKVPANTKPA